MRVCVFVYYISMSFYKNAYIYLYLIYKYIHIYIYIYISIYVYPLFFLKQAVRKYLEDLDVAELVDILWMDPQICGSASMITTVDPKGVLRGKLHLYADVC